MPKPEQSIASDRYAVIGHPISHSLSPRIQSLFAAQTRERLLYGALDVTAAELSARVAEFFAAGGRGLNVTVPHKQAVMALMDSLSERAQRAAAVNTVLLDASGLHGDNTDGVGLLRDLTQNLGIVVRAQRVLLLGAGGAARGVVAPLLAEDPSELVIANRNLARARALAQAHGSSGALRAVPFDELRGPFDLIINATAASLRGEVPAVPPTIVQHSSICYDMAYGAEQTAFLAWARQLGAGHTHMGLGMLVEQAAESFWLWRGVRPSTAGVLATLRAELGQ